MTRTALPLLATALLLPALPAHAGETLALLDAVNGKCFVADVGEGAHDTHCFAPVFGGKHVRDSHRVILQGKIVYRGETVYSLEDGAVTFTYFNSLGGVGHGGARAVPGGIVFTGSMRASPDARPQPMDSRWAWRKDGGYEVTAGKDKPVSYHPVGQTR